MSSFPPGELSFTQKAPKLLHCLVFPLLRTGIALPQPPSTSSGHAYSQNGSRGAGKPLLASPSTILGEGD